MEPPTMASETPMNPGMDPERLRALIEEGIPDAEVRVIDLTGTRDHYRVEVVSLAFEGKRRVQQHQMVYAAVGAHMTEAVHALQIRTQTPGSDAR